MAETTFESVTCRRCGGSGHYSYNALDGTMCYGCRGKGWKYTKRGQAAYDVYMRSLERTVAELEPGMVIARNGYGWNTVLAIEPSHRAAVVRNGERFYEGFDIVCKNLVICGESADTRFSVRPGEDEKQAKLQAALAYQETLTKQGKPRKVA